MERYISGTLGPHIKDIHRRLDELEDGSQSPSGQTQEPLRPPLPSEHPVPVPIMEPSSDHPRPSWRENYYSEGFDTPYGSDTSEPKLPSKPVFTDDRPDIQENEAISMEFEFGSKWLQYIGMIIVIVTFLLLGAYAIQYLTPLQENILMYICSFIILALGEYIYRTRETRYYGLGLVYGGLIVLYISCASSHYVYDLIPFQAFMLLAMVITTLNLILGFRYDTNLMVFKGLFMMFILITLIRVEDFTSPLGYSLLLPLATAIGSLVVFLRKNTELLMSFMLFSYLWVILSVLLMDKFAQIPLLCVITINMILIMAQQKNEKEFTSYTFLDEPIKLPLFLIALLLSYIGLIITTIVTIQSDAGGLFPHDGWVSLIFLFTLQFIFTKIMKLREDDITFNAIPFLCLIIMGLFTVRIDGSIYFYMILIFFVLAMNYKAILKGKDLTIFCFLTVALLIFGKVLIGLSDIGPDDRLHYYFEGMLIAFTIFFSFLNHKFNRDVLSINGTALKIYPVLFCLLLLNIATDPDLAFAYFIIPLILLFITYLSCDVFAFNISYILLTYNIFRSIPARESYPEIFVASSLILFFFALFHEFTDRKKVLAIITAAFSSIMFLISIAMTFGSDITTTLAWAGFGIFTIIVGLRSNTYYFRWIGLLFLLASTLKAFTFDIRVLSLELRILSFAVLGFVLLIISYIYTRYKSKIIATFGLNGQMREDLGGQQPPLRPPPVS